eukprot:TRINITY_DN11933_c0_g1_i11.p3 TRINITY_DN11933_c0_g1~~TRINITY_DN11933_c0_g1_i11.p3  ORF type:complete len:102 (+),score=0.89 TRINITY_DN11933_c0_g1_i11:1991-2296(+)
MMQLMSTMRQQKASSTSKGAVTPTNSALINRDRILLPWAYSEEEHCCILAKANRAHTSSIKGHLTTGVCVDAQACLHVQCLCERPPSSHRRRFRLARPPQE